MSQQVAIPPSRTLARATRDGIMVPRVIADAGDAAARRFLEFFAATIRRCLGILSFAYLGFFWMVLSRLWFHSVAQASLEEGSSGLDIRANKEAT
jgi:hypothetical protein